MATTEQPGVVARRQLVLVLADMVTEALAARSAMRYVSGDEEEVPDLQDDVLADDDMADVLHPGVQAEGAPQKAEGRARR